MSESRAGSYQRHAQPLPQSRGSQHILRASPPPIPPTYLQTNCSCTVDGLASRRHPLQTSAVPVTHSYSPTPAWTSSTSTSSRLCYTPTSHSTQRRHHCCLSEEARPCPLELETIRAARLSGPCDPLCSPASRGSIKKMEAQRLDDIAPMLSWLDTGKNLSGTLAGAIDWARNCPGWWRSMG
ncbi:uncharacterized protein BT62DRAFT_215181 [Guyanagaster necrorhizus]|uniref:Uncharacterized protein n=1 Tax=Guyanagaster necrorhizus TaxID=856835 RepID=A0A9P8AR10_9AGAR|nr:uncharacterized protein BT62DRAFT_215181 [Guyanagaster necrorhizus MCA 3950]KAG7444575.1 hypothetical protein BT62DRAFT_215181 [Guyanagaster necrorhizus MCA 3950]